LVDNKSQLSPLVAIDKSTLATTFVDSLADIAVLSDFGAALDSNGTSLFAYNCDSAKLATIVRLDGSTGQRLQTFTVGVGDCYGLTFSERKLYVQSPDSVYKLNQVDLQSGAVTATFTFGNWVHEVVKE
jgi:hypothetical protein